VYWVTLGEIGWKPGGRGRLQLPELPNIAGIEQQWVGEDWPWMKAA